MRVTVDENLPESAVRVVKAAGGRFERVLSGVAMGHLDTAALARRPGSTSQLGWISNPNRAKWSSKANAARMPARRMTSKLTMSTRLSSRI